MRKVFLTVMIALTIFSALVTEKTFAYDTVYEKSSSERISSGVILKNITRFGDKGWLNVHIAEVDLTDKYTSVGLLNSENGLNTFQTVLQMANAEGKNVVTAINGDFFNGNYKNGNTIGLSISEGEIYTSTYYENEGKDTFGTFVLDEENNGFFGYFSNKITLKVKGSEIELPIAEINKVSADYSFPVLYTSKWGENSVASKYDFPMTEMLVKNNKVVEIRNGGESFTIPENGFVISCCGTSAEYLYQNFKVRNKVELEVQMELDYEKVEMAISGGAMLLEKGKIPETFASNITGENPRTAIGLSKDGETLFLVTVDGRSASSVGLTQREFAELLLEKGVYEALNLDGGGSTTMVSRKLGEEDIKTVNSPSGGTLRMVTNAVGVYNIEKTSSLSSIVLKIPEENVFVNSQREIEILGYDKYYNPVKVNDSKIKWSYRGVPVEVKDGIILTGKEAGTATITAKIGKAEGSISIDVLSAPNEIEISPKEVGILLGDAVTFETKVKNKNGYVASMQNEELTFQVVSGDGRFEKNRFIPSKEGDHVISVSAGSAVSYAKVTVGQRNTVLMNDFEKENFIFTSYPEGVKGQVSLSKDQKYEGRYSAKLEYDFTTTDATRAVYLRFENEGMKLPENAEKITFRIFSKESKEDHIKLKIVDAKGNVNLVTASNMIPEGEWAEVSYSLNKILLPAKLTDIYVVQDNPEIKNTGTIYLDYLMLEEGAAISISKNALPEDIKGIDSAHQESNVTKEESLKVLVYDAKKDVETLLDVYTQSKIHQKMDLDADVIIWMEEMAYGVREYENTTVITLDISKGGLRSTDYKQWIHLQSDITNTSSPNILLVMNGSLNDFSDKEEKQLLIDVLCELRRSSSKNIWVICKGEKTTYSMERGVRYLSINNSWINRDDPMEVAQNQKYIMITVLNHEMSYEMKRVFE